MKTVTFFLIALFANVAVFAQVPQSFRYQAVARDNSGNVLANQEVSFQISILNGSVSGTVEYSETHTGKTTNTFGLVELEIGNGTPVAGTFSSIGWGSNIYFVKIEMDPAGGSAYQILSISQLLSVPYALHAKTATNYDETDPTWVGAANENSSIGRTGNVGIGITTPASKLDVDGEINVNSNKITNVASPVNAQDAATKAYVDKLLKQLGLIVEDVEGNIYTKVQIGSQVWMAENLRTAKFNDGIAIPLVTDNTAWYKLTTPGYCWYNNEKATYGTIYGVLYNWYAVNTEKLCPTGWHVPSDAEWTTLEIYLQNNGYNYDGSIDTDNDRSTNNKTAKSLAATTNWTESTVTGVVGNTDFPLYRNKTGFSGLPGGYRDNYGNFGIIGGSGIWWSSTENSTTNAWSRYLNYDGYGVGRFNGGREYGFSVRCVRDF